MTASQCNDLRRTYQREIQNLVSNITISRVVMSPGIKLMNLLPTTNNITCGAQTQVSVSSTVAVTRLDSTCVTTMAQVSGPVMTTREHRVGARRDQGSDDKTSDSDPKGNPFRTCREKNTASPDPDQHETRRSANTTSREDASTDDHQQYVGQGISGVYNNEFGEYFLRFLDGHIVPYDDIFVYNAPNLTALERHRIIDKLDRG